MTPEERARAIETAVGAWRPRDRDGAIRALPDWHDLDADARIEVYSLARSARVLEAALDPSGVSATGRAVLARIRRGAV